MSDRGCKFGYYTQYIFRIRDRSCYINGDLVMNGGILNIKMDAPDSDHINVFGQAVFNPNTEVHFEFINGYQPQLGGSVDWFIASGFSGIENLTYLFFGLPQGINLSLGENPGTGSLSWTAIPTAAPLPPALWSFGSSLIGFGLFRRRATRPYPDRATCCFAGLPADSIF
jgi:hypothetical protein